MDLETRSMISPTLHFHVTGRVQGVWFRGWTQLTARSLELAGWVRNEPDGSVRGAAQGKAAALESFRLALHEGPPSSLVAAVEATLRTDEPEVFQGFIIRR